MIDGRGKLLRGKKNLWLDRARLAILSFRYVEDDRMSVKLRRDVAVNRAGGVVLELCRDELAGGLRRIIPADAGLGVVFELVESSADTLTVRLANALVAANECGERD